MYGFCAVHITYRVEKHVSRLTYRRYVHHARLVKCKETRSQRASELKCNGCVPMGERVCALLLSDGFDVLGCLGERVVRWDGGIHFDGSDGIL
jgi:hypothetical protein